MALQASSVNSPRPAIVSPVLCLVHNEGNTSRLIHQTDPNEKWIQVWQSVLLRMKRKPYATGSLCAGQRPSFVVWYNAGITLM
jgi:hypothetical protein